MQWRGSIKLHEIKCIQVKHKYIKLVNRKYTHRSNIELANQFYRTLTVVSCANRLLLNVDVGPKAKSLISRFLISVPGNSVTMKNNNISLVYFFFLTNTHYFF